MSETDRPNRKFRRARSPIIGLAGLTAWMLWRSLRRSRRSELAIAAAARKREEERPMTAYEPTDWDVGPVALVYAGVVALLVISCIVLIAAYPRSLPDANRDLHIAPPGPRLQTNAGADLQRFREQENKRLNTFYWIDQQKGVVHIPIEQAMKKLADTGIPGFPKDAK
jgi:hypothetical protein